MSILHRSYAGRKYYADGVGSDWYSTFLGGAFGLGGRARLEAMYANLVEAYKDGDTDIDIIGFSRGASLAREFANMIYERGVVETNYQYEPRRGHGVAHKQVTTKVLDCNPTIRFVGLFDTVGSFGVPGNRINIGIHMDLPPNVRNAAQAIAADERRKQFPLTPLNPARNGQLFSQQVFPGDHSDVGGGHMTNQNLLALRPLIYMQQQGIQAGAPFGPLELGADEGGLYLNVRGEIRPWPYRMNAEPHDLTGVWYYSEGGRRQNLPLRK